MGRSHLGIEIVSANTIYFVTIWAIPVIIAITFHEAAHGFVALLLGDNTAWRLGRVSFNPLKHVDPFGTILLPGVLLLVRSPFCSPAGTTCGSDSVLQGRSPHDRSSTDCVL
jgi:Zn-dependent protease